MSEKQYLMELEILKTKMQRGQVTKKRRGKAKRLKAKEIENAREICLERVNIHLERLIEKANRDKKMLRHMAYHYMTHNKICNMRIRKLKARLKKALKRKKEQDKLKILAEASLAH